MENVFNMQTLRNTLEELINGKEPEYNSSIGSKRRKGESRI